MSTRSAAVPALVTLLSGARIASATPYVGRLLTIEQAMEPPALPSILIEGAEEEVERKINGPARRVLTVHLILTVAVPDGIAPGAALDAALDDLDAAMAPAPGFDLQTLGGSCAHAWIEGAIKRFEVGFETSVQAIVPVQILLP